MNISLPQELKNWVDEQVETGGYGTASEYLRDLLRKARERQLRQGVDGLLLAAVEAGSPASLDAREWSSVRKAARARVRPKRKK